MISCKARLTAMMPRQTRYTGKGARLRAAPSPMGMEMRMPTTEAAISNGVFRDLYVVIGDAQDNGGWAVRTYIKPFANWIWGGTIIMALGGLLSLTDRRYRVAAGARRSAPLAQPAE